MEGRGKKSAAALAVVPLATAPRLHPRPEMDPAAAEIFNAIVSYLPNDHFRREDAALLEAFCNATLLERKASEVMKRSAVIGSKVSPWHGILAQQQKALVNLAAKLRISPQSRIDALQAGRNARNHQPSAAALMGIARTNDCRTAPARKRKGDRSWRRNGQ